MNDSTWKQTLVAVPGVGMSLMPKLLCPACWPAYRRRGLLPGLRHEEVNAGEQQGKNGNPGHIDDSSGGHHR